VSLAQSNVADVVAKIAQRLKAFLNPLAGLDILALER
jgi:hypothetical protein